MTRIIGVLSGPRGGGLAERSNVKRYRITSLLAATIAIAGLAACGSSSSKSESSNSTNAPGTTSAPGTTTAGGCKTASDAYVKTVGSVSDFKPVTADTLTVVTSLP